MTEPYTIRFPPRGSRSYLFQPRSVGQHLLRDPGEALDAPAQRTAAANQRGPAIVQLAAAYQHGSYLGHLARVAAQAVRLRVDDEELRGCDRTFEQRHDLRDTRRAGRHASRIARPRGASVP